MLQINMSTHTESIDTVSKKLVNGFGRLTYRRLMVVFSAICLSLVLFVGLLNSFQYDFPRVQYQEKYLNWVLRGGSYHASTADRPHRQEVEDSLGNIYIKHQYEDWLKQSGNQSFDLRPHSRFMKQQALIQRQRKATLQQVCRKHPELRDVQFTRANTRAFFVAEKSRLFYCLLPKVGCTNWKKVLMVLEGQRKHVWNITGYEAHKRSYLRNMSHMPQEERENIIQTYSKFLYVRHPFVRLISAYRNKIGRDISQQGKVFRGYARRIVSKYRPGASLEQLELGGNYNVTWDEWITYLTDPEQLSGFNEHWKEFYKLCFPCRIPYDFIGRLETISADSAYMLSVLGYDNMLYPSSHATSSSVLYDQYFANVSRANLFKLWKIFALDFKLFGFQKPERLTA